MSVNDDVVENEMTIIPYSALSKEAIESLISDFILREGTDYGENEVNFAQKAEQLHQCLKKGELQISFCHATDSCNLL